MVTILDHGILLGGSFQSVISIRISSFARLDLSGWVEAGPPELGTSNARKGEGNTSDSISVADVDAKRNLKLATINH